jgi:hypothetical protein
MRESRRAIRQREGITAPDGRTWSWVSYTMARTRRGGQTRLECWRGTCPRCGGPHQIARKVPRGPDIGYVFSHSVCDACRRPNGRPKPLPADCSDLV